MTRIKTVPKEEAKAELRSLYQNIEKGMGKVPNIFLNMGNSPLVLKAFLSLNEASHHTSLNPKILEKIALIVGQANNCNYCLSAHSAIAKGLGIDDKEILQARHGESPDPKTQAILKFVQTVVKSRAQVTNQDIATLKNTGVTDSEIVEITLAIIVNMFTNYFNLITDPKIDFPIAPELN